MSPVEPSRNHVGNAATVTLVAVVILGLGLWLAASVLSRHTSALSTSHTFHGGNAANIAGSIERDGPINYGDVSGRSDRPIILQHLGSNPKKGWYAFLAFPDDKDADCSWEWQPEEHLFRAACDHSLTAPADGTGLTRFPVTVHGGNLSIDLDPATTTSTTTSTAPRATTTTTR